jgi:hypothetical protein
MHNIKILPMLQRPLHWCREVYALNGLLPEAVKRMAAELAGRGFVRRFPRGGNGG